MEQVKNARARAIAEQRRSNAAGLHVKRRNRRNEKREAIRRSHADS